jgi:hypothetical protein
VAGAAPQSNLCNTDSFSDIVSAVLDIFVDSLFAILLGVSSVSGGSCILFSDDFIDAGMPGASSLVIGFSPLVCHRQFASRFPASPLPHRPGHTSLTSSSPVSAA